MLHRVSWGAGRIASRLHYAAKPAGALVILAIAAVVLSTQHARMRQDYELVERLYAAYVLLTAPLAWFDHTRFESEQLEALQDIDTDSISLAVGLVILLHDEAYGHPVNIRVPAIGETELVKLRGRVEAVEALRREDKAQSVTGATYCPFGLGTDGEPVIIVATDYPYWTGFDHAPLGTVAAYVMLDGVRRGPFAAVDLELLMLDILRGIGVNAPDAMTGVRHARFAVENARTQIPTLGTSHSIPAALLGLAWLSAFAAAGLVVQCSPGRGMVTEIRVPGRMFGGAVTTLLDGIALAALVAVAIAPAVIAQQAAGHAPSMLFARLALTAGLLGSLCTIAAAACMLVPSERPEPPVDVVD